MKTKPIEIYYITQSLRPFYIPILIQRLNVIFKKPPELEAAKVLVKAARKGKVNFFKKLDILELSFSQRSLMIIIEKIESSIFYVCLDDRLILRKGRYAKMHQERFLIRKELIHYTFLKSTNLIEIAWKKLLKIISTCKKYEFYDQLVIALHYKVIHLKTIKSKSEFELTMTEIEFYESCRRQYNTIIANWNFYSVTKFEDFPHSSTIKSLENQLIFAVNAYKTTNSKNIKCLFLFHQVDYLNTKHLYSYAISIGTNLLRLIKSTIYLDSYVRKLMVSAIIYFIKLRQLKFDLENYKSAELSVFSSLNVTKLIYLSQELIFLKEYQKCLAILEQLDIDFLKEQKRIDAFKFTFFKGIAHFLLGNYQDFHQVFSDMGDLEKDKEGWNAWIKIYRILAHIEEKKYDLVDYEIESFRKYAERLKKKSLLKKREELIAKTLIKLKNEAYDYQKFYLKHQNLVNALQAVSGKGKWDFDSPEKILFHDWILSRVNKLEYNPNFEPYRKQLEIESQIQEKKLRASPDFEKMGFQF